LRILAVETNEGFERIRELFVTYADSLGFDLGFQDFEQELADLAEYYAPPDGCLLLATSKGQPAGCVALKKFGEDVCEMKRLYVKPEFRSLGIGRALAEAIIERARKSGYTRMRLDMVLPRDAARSLYLSMGFEDIEPYRYNPMEGAVFMELKLT
jgi:GNAT superfamily N-acetyltransferase